MLLAELKIGDTFAFHPDDDSTVYTVEHNGRISWIDRFTSIKHDCGISLYLDRRVTYKGIIKMNAIEALQAIKAGKKVWQPTWGKCTGRPNYIHLKNGKIWSNYGEREYSFYVYNFDEVWEEYIDPPVEVKLNKEYSAVLTKDGIEVGCQKFTYEKLDELVNASKEFRKT